MEESKSHKLATFLVQHIFTASMEEIRIQTDKKTVHFYRDTQGLALRKTLHINVSSTTRGQTKQKFFNNLNIDPLPNG